MSLQGKVAFITGAARGMGRTHAVRLARDGASIIAVDLCRDVDGVQYGMGTDADLEETKRLVEAAGQRCVALGADVRDLEQLRAAVSAGVAELGGLDIVCANAGVVPPQGNTWELTDEAWTSSLEVNLTGVWKTIKATAPVMIEQGRGGSMILMSSTGGLRGISGNAHYCAAKHGVIGIGRVLAGELAPYSIRVNSICPSAVSTAQIHRDSVYRLHRPDQANPTREDAAAKFQTLNQLPVPWMEPEDVSAAVAWLASDDARYVTGTEVVVDAGALARYA